MDNKAMDAKQMRCWWEGQLVSMAARMSRTSVSTRINSLSRGIDAWVKLFRAENDTIAVEELSQRLEELEQRLRNGPQGIVADGKN